MEQEVLPEMTDRVDVDSQGIRHLGESVAADGGQGLPAAQDLGGDEEVVLIDKTLLEEAAVELLAALQQDGVDAHRAELAQHVLQVDASVVGLAGEGLDAAVAELFEPVDVSGFRVHEDGADAAGALRDAALGGEGSEAVGEDADGILVLGQAAVQHRVVGTDGACAHADAGMAAAEPMDENAGPRGGHPAGIPVRRGDLAVQRHGDLQGHPGPSFGDVLQEDAVLLADLVRHQADFHLDAVLAENLDALAADERVGIGQAHDDAGDAGFQEGVRAGRLFAVVAAGLQGDIGRRAGRILRAGREGLPFGVEVAVLAVPAAADGTTVFDEDASDHRVRGRVAVSSFRKGDCLLHVLLVRLGPESACCLHIKK